MIGSLLQRAVVRRHGTETVARELLPESDRGRFVEQMNAVEDLIADLTGQTQKL